MSGSVTGSSNSVTMQSYIELNPDGRCRESGFSSANFSNEIDKTTTQRTVRVPSRRETERYKINDFRLTLALDNGRPEYFTIVLEDTTPATKGLFIAVSVFIQSTDSSKKRC